MGEGWGVGQKVPCDCEVKKKRRKKCWQKEKRKGISHTFSVVVRMLQVMLLWGWLGVGGGVDCLVLLYVPVVLIDRPMPPPPQSELFS